MARLLFVCTGLFSNLFSTLALARGLRADGFDIRFAAPASCREDIVHAGFAVTEIAQPQFSLRALYLARPGLWRSPSLRRRRMQAAADVLLQDGVAEALQDAAPDLVIADCEHHSAILQSLANGHRVMVLSFIYATPPGPQRPPLTSDIVPGHGPRGGPAAIQNAWRALRRKSRVSQAWAAWHGWGADLTAAHRTLADRLGVDLSRHTMQTGFQRPWSYTLPTLLLVAASVDLPGAPAPHQVFAGPMVLTDRRLRTTAAPQLRFFTRPDAERRIYAGFGSMRRPPERFVSALTEIASARPEWEFLVANLAPDIARGRALPDNFQIVGWAPQFEALKRADAAIFHGGAGTLNECLETQTPMLIYPNALDGAGNGARVVFHGLGRVGRYTDPRQTIATDLDAVLNDAQFRANLRLQHAELEKTRTDNPARQAILRALGR